MAHEYSSKEALRTPVRPGTSWLAGGVFVLLMLLVAGLDGNATLAIYALSFWHYLLYWLAYVYGAVSPRVFRRDALTMKSVALIALGAAYFAAPFDPVSLAVVAAGFALNGVAAAALGPERTYYGYELADLPPLRITAFPYSVIGHPMLVGNILAFGGTMINAEFREAWWPLACAHVAMNLGLLAMELYVTPQRRHARPAATAGGGPAGRRWSWPGVCGMIAAGAALGAAAGAALGAAVLPAAGIGAGMLGYGCVLYCCYAWPSSLPEEPRNVQTENSHE